MFIPFAVFVIYVKVNDRIFNLTALIVILHFDQEHDPFIKAHLTIPFIIFYLLWKENV